ncbi:hypothetical protein WICMUC_001972 [Wickerhamomyces mucosus]|uniref:TLC domain-containing protein n=1 Tax=Wickerhamomyces mucosus TaxID=1378264 RepID=A0A9P8PRS2_9ASCO|nr:hypothetical protein WICMUC_001972 [Wickerhamomyces mucosus]
MSLINSSLKKNETIVSQRLSDSSNNNSSSSSSSSSSDLEIDNDIPKRKNILKKKRNHSNKKNISIKGESHYSIELIDKLQLIISFSLIVSIIYLNNFPVLNKYLSRFLKLHYKYEGTNLYDIGIDDAYIVLSGVVLMTFIRSFSMLFILRPITKLMNINSQKPVQRFLEQGWYLIYYSSSFIFGSYIYYNSPYFLNLDHIWIGWPYDKLSPLTKTYYLFELACWFHQLFILNIEAKRKDHVQMFTHHVITIALISGSYYYYFTRIGNCILVIMDFVDIFLALAKVLKYCGFQLICDLMFLNFLVSWVVLRCGLYNYIFYHTAFKGRDLMKSTECIVGLFQKRCWTNQIIDTFLVLLGSLQVLMIIWLGLIVKVAYKVITGNGADDVRSDDED